MEGKQMKNLTQLNESYVEQNRRIIILFLEKLELLTKEERAELFITIKYINHPIFVS